MDRTGPSDVDAVATSTCIARCDDDSGESAEGRPDDESFGSAKRPDEAASDRRRQDAADEVETLVDTRHGRIANVATPEMLTPFISGFGTHSLQLGTCHQRRLASLSE